MEGSESKSKKKRLAPELIARHRAVLDPLNHDLIGP